MGKVIKALDQLFLDRMFFPTANRERARRIGYARHVMRARMLKLAELENEREWDGYMYPPSPDVDTMPWMRYTPFKGRELPGSVLVALEVM